MLIDKVRLTQGFGRRLIHDVKAERITTQVGLVSGIVEAIRDSVDEDSKPSAYELECLTTAIMFAVFVTTLWMRAFPVSFFMDESDSRRLGNEEGTS